MDRILNFQMAGRLIIGAGALAELADALKHLGVQKPLLVTDPGLVKAGLAGRVQAVLDAASVPYAVYDKVEPDPRVEIVAECHQAAVEAGCDAFVGVGGGSSIDIAKVASILTTNPGNILDYVGIGKIPKKGAPIIAIPTTAGTGSEVTPIAVLSDTQAQLKKGVVSDFLYPDLALVDPELTLGLPPHITAATGIDTLTHAIEAYTNKHAHPFIDAFALEAIRLVGRSLRIACHTGTDLTARTEMARASLLGGLCLGSVNTAAVHALAYPLGGSYHVPHGVANSLLLPYVMRFNLPSQPQKFADIAIALSVDPTGQTTAQLAEAAVEATVQLSADCGIVSQMRDLNIPENAIEPMAKAAMQVTRLLNNNPREVTEADAAAIYREAW
ncbi:MAG: iron-containing alcohol dehydrogenase [Opitutales bacterium]